MNTIAAGFRVERYRSTLEPREALWMVRWPGCGSGWRGRRGLLRQAPVTVETTIENTLPDAFAEEAKGA
jgi:hypothetical protein